MKLKPSIEKLLQDRYYLGSNKSWKGLCERVSGVYPPALDMMLKQKFLPSSPTLMNANTKGKRKGTLSSCFPMGLDDSIDGIFDALKEAAIVTKMGGGTGYVFSSLRGSTEIIESLGRYSSGPIPFMDNFSVMKDSIRQGGVRRGAGMGQLDETHPNIWDFAEVKKDYRSGRLSRMNLSCRMSNDFYHKLEWSPDAPFETINVGNGEKHPLTRDGETITYAGLWKHIIHHAWLSGEPGIFNKDLAHERCTVTNVNDLVLSNPCAEFVNIPYTSCNLGSLNLVKYVRNRKFDWETYKADVETATLFLDSVIDINNYPLDKIEKVTKSIRPIGLGIMGLAHAFFKMGIPYSSPEATRFTEEVMWFTTMTSMSVSIDLAKKHGAYEAYNEELFLKANTRFWAYNGERHGIDLEHLLAHLDKVGVRNSCFTSVAPTGSISFIADSSSGIEPVFALAFVRKIEKLNKQYDEVYITDHLFESYINRRYKAKKDKILKYVVDHKGSCQGCPDLSEEEQKVFATARDIPPLEHLDVLAASAQYTSLSVSKTINLPKDATEEQVGEVYLQAFKKGVIGVTVYRDGCREGILVDKADDGSKLVKTQAPKRPKELTASVIHFTTQRRKFYVVVGLYADEPYEVFTGQNYNNDGDVLIPTSVKEGVIIKSKRGDYKLWTGEEGEKEDFYNLTDGHTDPTANALTRMLSTSLRHGVDISFIVHQLEKTRGDMASFARFLARTLKEYIKNGTKVYGEHCPNCKGETLIRESGCKKCAQCGHSLCS